METQERVRRRTVSATARKRDPQPQLDLKKLLRTLQSVRDGDFSVRLRGDQEGLAGKVADTLNEIIATNQQLAREMDRAGQLVDYTKADAITGAARHCTGCGVVPFAFFCRANSFAHHGHRATGQYVFVRQ